MIRSRSRPCDSRPGISAVECALVMPFLVALMLGMFEISRILLVKESLSNATQRACRTATLPGKSNADAQKDITDSLSKAGIKNYQTSILINGKTGDVRNATKEDKISVQISVSVKEIFWISTYFVKPTMVASEAVVMMRQG